VALHGLLGWLRQFAQEIEVGTKLGEQIGKRVCGRIAGQKKQYPD
jgi:hypothetical protein